MGVLKFWDEPKFKFFDDPIGTHKTTDDPITLWEGSGGFTIQEGTITLAEGTFTAAEGTVINPGDILTNPAVFSGSSAQPFVLANPHHSMDWTKTFGNPNAPEVRKKQYEIQMKQLELMKTHLNEQVRQLDEVIGKMNKELEDMNNQPTQ